MLNTYGRSIMLFILLVCSSSLHAQRDNSRFFDDGNLEGRKNILKFDALSAINGDIAFFYERVFNRSFSLEVGLGKLLSRYEPSGPTPWLDRPDTFRDIESGNSIWVNPRYYISKGAPEAIYVGIQWRQRNFDQMGMSFRQTAIFWTFGYQEDWRRNILYGIDFGVGYHSEKETSGVPGSTLNGVGFTGSLKVAYSF